MPGLYHTANASEAQARGGGFIYSMALTRLDLLGLYVFQVFDNVFDFFHDSGPADFKSKV